MIGGASDFGRLRNRLMEIQHALGEQGLDGWLLYDLHARNGVSGQLLGLGDMSRRYFVMVPVEGEPRALIHGIETGPWEAWPWESEQYVGWKSLHERLAGLVDGRTVAMEVSAEDAVPAVDLVPSGVVELVRASGARVVSSADLITRFYARWSEEGLASHRRASRVLADVARAAFAHAAEVIGADGSIREGALRQWVFDRLEERGTAVGRDSIVANGLNAANPHYDTGEEGAIIQKGDVVLLDLWAKEAEDAIYADQTWMAFMGPEVPERVQHLWEAIRDARDAAVTFLQKEWTAGRDVQGCQVDDAARAVIVERGLGGYFIHRTGHSIDQDTHGMGPNIDNLETRETRTLIPGVGFSIEPGVYVSGEVGLRTEINVHITENGPEVTSPDTQAEIFTFRP